MCDLVPKISAARSLRCLEKLRSCETATEEASDIDIRPLAHVQACLEDVPTTLPQKFFRIAGTTEYAICEDCYFTTIELDAKAVTGLKHFATAN